MILFLFAGLSISSCGGIKVLDTDIHATMDDIYSSLDTTRQESEIVVYTKDSIRNGFFLYRYYENESDALKSLQFFIVAKEKIYLFTSSENKNYRLSKRKLRRHLSKDQMEIIRRKIFVNYNF